MPKSLAVPFSLASGSVASTGDPQRLIEQKIVNVATTSFMERVALPEYGANVSSMLFDSMSKLEALDFKTDLALAVQNYVSGVTIEDVTTVAEPDTGRVLVTVAYRDYLSASQTVTFGLALPDSLTEESPLA